MKLKAKISGPKVHDVGYRYFLMNLAINMALKGFNALNKTGEMGQEVIALVEGDEESIADFRKMVETKRPERSQVSSIAFEEHTGDVMKTESYAQICSAIQLNKAIPVLLDLRDNVHDMKSSMDNMKSSMDDMKSSMDDMKSSMDDMKSSMDSMKSSMDEVQKNTAATPQILEEVRAIREDIQPGHGMSLRQVQRDIKAIKEELGMI